MSDFESSSNRIEDALITLLCGILWYTTVSPSTSLSSTVQLRIVMSFEESTFCRATTLSIYILTKVNTTYVVLFDRSFLWLQIMFETRTSCELEGCPRHQHDRYESYGQCRFCRNIMMKQTRSLLTQSLRLFSDRSSSWILNTLRIHLFSTDSYLCSSAKAS